MEKLDLEKLTAHLCDVQVTGKGWISPIAGADFETQPKWVSLALSGDVLLGLGAVLRHLN